MTSAMCVIETWYDILGNCNYDDVIRLQDVAEGMQIPGKACKPDQECEVCIQKQSKGSTALALQVLYPLNQ